MPKLVKIDKRKAKRVTHDKCGAVIDYFMNEVEYSQIGYYDGSTDTVGYIECPNCKETFQVC